MTRQRPGTATLRQLREEPLYHWLGLVVGLILGLVVANFHWIGLVGGGAIVGLFATNLFRAILAGVGFGVIAIAVWALPIWYAGNLGKVLAMGEIAVLTVGMGLVLPLFGSLIRGVT